MAAAAADLWRVDALIIAVLHHAFRFIVSLIISISHPSLDRTPFIDHVDHIDRVHGTNIHTVHT